jgi:hypothetical protein
MSDEPKTPRDAPKQPATGGKDTDGKGKEPRAPATTGEAPVRKGEAAAGERGPVPPSAPAAAPAGTPAEAAAPKPVPPAAASPAPARARTGALWLAVVLLFLGFGWLLLERLAAPAADPALAALASRVAALEGRPAPAAGPDLRPEIAALERRIAAIEQRGEDLSALAGRVAALERAISAAAQGPASDAGTRAALGALADRVAALEARPAPQPPPDPRIPDLAARLAALEARPAADPRVAALAERVAALEARPGMEARVAALEARMTAFVRAQAALEAGRPLGPALAALPQGVTVPASLAAFAERAPPTLGTLRLRFVEAARAAREAREPAEGDMLDRATSRIAGLVTVRRGDTVVLGDATASVLADAERRLDAGDLAGAVAALDRLPARPAAAMAGWVAEARALLAARDGLAALAAGG